MTLEPWIEQDKSVGRGWNLPIIQTVVGFGRMNHGSRGCQLSTRGGSCDHKPIGVKVKFDRVFSEVADRGLRVFDAFQRNLDVIHLLQTVFGSRRNHSPFRPVEALRVMGGGAPSTPTPTVKDNVGRISFPGCSRFRVSIGKKHVQAQGAIFGLLELPEHIGLSGAPECLEGEQK